MMAFTRSRVFRALLLLASALAGALVWIAFGPLPPSDRAVLDNRDNGVWLGHRWFADDVPEADVARLADRLRTHRIRDLFFHVGPLDARGRIPATSSAHWERTLETLRQRVPRIRAFAWLGGVTTWSYGVADDTLDCALPEVRRGIVQTAGILLKDARFDGIHYDIEQIPNGDGGFLSLLDDTRPACSLLSVATNNLRTPWLPIPQMWSDAYCKEVARRCDQIAVMGYDTALLTPRMYSRYMAWEARYLCALVPDRAILIGVPTYRESTLSHRPGAETLDAALEGLALGLSARPAAFQGTAIYAEWTTTSEDWARFPR